MKGLFSFVLFLTALSINAQSQLFTSGTIEGVETDNHFYAFTKRGPQLGLKDTSVFLTIVRYHNPETSYTHETSTFFQGKILSREFAYEDMQQYEVEGVLYTYKIFSMICHTDKGLVTGTVMHISTDTDPANPNHKPESEILFTKLEHSKWKFQIN